MNEALYITTPIYYINGDPHLGHAYTTLLADSLARASRLAGRETFFLTGTDEHGLKTYQAALASGLSPLAYADYISDRFQTAWRELNVQYDDFLRTTQPRHEAVVREVLQGLWQRGEIYKGEYVGWYCVPDERFYTDKDVQDGRCPECGRAVERVSEPDYFFRMSSYQDWLVEYIQNHPDFIRPSFRRNEVLGFLRKPLADLCISRPRSRLDWGIPLPFDPDFVTYIWFDALLNYVTAAGYGQDEARFAQTWPNAFHLMGKDILTTHAVYWPTMLKALGLPMPRAIYAHGWWVVEGRKMGKSLGNAVRPLDLAKRYSPDGFRYFLLREMLPGQDCEFSEERLAARYQSDLANNYGNLLQRLTSMTVRYCGGKVPEPEGGELAEALLRERFEALPGRFFEQAACLDLAQGLGEVMEALDRVNQYLEERAPWKQAIAGNRGAVNTALYTASEALRIASGLLSCALPQQALEAQRRLGADAISSADGLAWGALTPGRQVTSGSPLFPRLAG
jgi:methionyl-tRNA synthetase